MNDSWKMLPVSVENIVQGIVFYKYVPVFWYMFYLIFFILVSPILYFFIESKIRGGLFLVVYIILCTIGTPYCFMVFFMYSLGGYISIHFFDYVDRKFTKKQSYIGLAVFIITAAIRVVLIKKGIDVVVPIQVITVVLMGVGLFAFSELLIGNNKMTPLINRQFFIYATHLFILSLVKKILRMILPGGAVFALLTYIICPIMVIVIANVTAICLERNAPRIYCVLSGGRMANKA